MILRLHDISKRFGPTVALDGVNLDLESSEVHALIGENGAGKSTLMNVLAGGLKPDRGQIWLRGEPYHPSSPLDGRRHGIALIHQELSLCPHLTVAENILMGIEPGKWGWLDRQACRRKTSEVLEYFHHPAVHPDAVVKNLPLAARQVVEICRAIAGRANIILMDEPTSSLSRDDADHLFALIRRLRDASVSVIYISHFLEEVREIADRYTVLRDGKSVGTGQLESVTNEQLIGLMVGRPVGSLFPHRARTEPGETVLTVGDLAAPGVKSASFELKRGEILGIAGLIGSGRTEMVRALFGLDPSYSGSVVLRGKAMSAQGGLPALRMLQGLGYLTEDRKGEGLALSLSVADNITLTRFGSCSRWGWLSRSRQREQTGAWIERMGIRAETPFQITGFLSGGNQQKVALARLLHQDADILLLDEPTRGIDIGSKAQIYEIIARCADELKAVLIVSSYLPELFGLCDRLAVMSRGRLSEPRPIRDWTPESVMQTAIGSA